MGRMVSPAGKWEDEGHGNRGYGQPIALGLSSKACRSVREKLLPSSLTVRTARSWFSSCFPPMDI